MGGLVVAGTDGSESSLAAVVAAAREARWRGAALRVVHAFLLPMTHAPLDAVPPGLPDDGLVRTAEELVAEAVEHARATAPEVAVSSAVLAGDPLSVLVEESRGAEVVVLGSRGTGAFGGLLVGSTAVDLAAHGRCPVLVVRGGGDASGPVLLGVDGSPAGERAVAFAFAEAARRGTGLVALHAWTMWNAALPPPQDPTMPYSNPPGALAESAERLLAEALAGYRERYPQVPVERRAVRGRTREALIEASRSAQLTVVGARGRGGFAGLLLGSVSQALLHHAHSPVAVVRGAAAEGGRR